MNKNEKKGSSITAIVTIRRVIQALFLGLFCYLFFNTVFRGDFKAGPQTFVRPVYPIKLFFDLDPLAAIGTLLSSWTIYKGLIWSALTISLTLIMGRFFCGWICPLGTIHHSAGAIKPSLKSIQRIKFNKLNSAQSVKYYILIAFLVASLIGSTQVGLLDPMSFLWRSLTASVLPSAHYVWDSFANLIYSYKIPYLFVLIDYINYFFDRYIFPGSSFLFHYGWLIGIVFVIFLYLNRKYPRFWCRYICPLGALLGIFSKTSILGLQKDISRCNDCDLCVLDCQGAANPQGKDKWVVSECMMCFNCWGDCPRDAIKFKFFPDNKQTTRNVIDLNRRTLVLSAGAGLLFVPLARATDSLDKNYNPYLIRPPGALEEKEFLKRCLKCGECMKICPTNALHPALFEGGIEGLWSPILIPRIGYCENSCVLCGYTCPTGAIHELVEKEKPGLDGKCMIKIGLAAVDRGRCLPWALKIPCIVCEEHCPTSPKAIYLEKTIVKDRNGSEITVQLPYVDPNLCWGCGICENKCPVKDKPAIYVTNIGETRSKTNQLLLGK